jgi:hypothetical protein
MQDLDQQLERARRTFGRFLRNWRKSNGWVITTPQDWAKACPDIIPPGFRVSSGQWANLENGKVQQAQPSTFIQLALLNQALTRPDRGAIADALLRERVNAGRPVLLPGGAPWAAEHWFACFIGNLHGPAELWPQEDSLTERADQMRRRFTALVEQQNLQPVTALVQLLMLVPGLSLERQMGVEAVLLQGDAKDSADLDLAEGLINRWE